MGIARRRRKPTKKLPTRAIGWGLLAGLFVVGGCLVAPRGGRIHTEGEPIVRVRVLANVSSVDLVIDGVAKTVNATTINQPTTYGSKSDAIIQIAGRQFHGDVRLVPVDHDSFDVINVIGIEDYVAGVVPREEFAKWPLEALKSQAVAARTYAIYQLKVQDQSGKSFDVHADVRSQAYGGVDDEEPSTNEAVNATRGIVLTYGRSGSEKIFCTYFSSTCGGLTASGADVFDDKTPTLKEHVNDGCGESPRYRWPEVVLKKDELTRRIRIWGERNKMSIANMAKLRSIEITERNSIGRPSRFVVTDETGRRFALEAEQMRNACNADGPKDVQIFSSFFTPIATPDSIRFTDGRGWGHGVGLCQWCIAGWSKRGMKFEAILKRSYPGATLVKAY